MQLRHALYGCALFILGCTGAVAQEDPEAVYAKLHSAALAGNAEEMMSVSTAAAKAELAAKPQAERDAVIRAMAQALPRTYAITEKNIAGNSAVLLGTGVSEYPTRAEAYLTASFRKEGEAWKVASWGWSNQKPPPPAAKPAVPAVATPAADTEPLGGIQIVRRLPAAAAAPARPEGAPAPVSVASRPSRAHLDARVCLRQSTERAVRACAEKYR